jgi:hypothetical protein
MVNCALRGHIGESPIPWAYGIGGWALGRVLEGEVRFRFQRYGIDVPVVKP